MEEYAREPCPYRIVDDCGGAFAMGCIGGGVFQSIKGFRNAPSGFSRRMVRYFIIILILICVLPILKSFFDWRICRHTDHVWRMTK